MFETIFNDLTATIEAVVSGQDYKMLAIMAVLALGLGLTMPKWVNAWGRAGQGVLLLALVMFVWDGLDNESRFELANWDAEGQESWFELMAMPVKTILGYYVVMLLGVSVVKGVKTVVQR